MIGSLHPPCLRTLTASLMSQTKLLSRTLNFLLLFKYSQSSHCPSHTNNQSSGRSFCSSRPLAQAIISIHIAMISSTCWERHRWNARAVFIMHQALNTVFRWLSGKESACQCRRHRRCRFELWVRKILWKRKPQPIPLFLPGKSHGQRNLVGFSLWGLKESDITEHTHTALQALNNYWLNK